MPSWLAPTPPPLPSWIRDSCWVPPGSRGLYAYARTGLYQALAGLQVDVDGEILLPAYIACSVVDASAAYGLNVSYYDVESDLSIPEAQVRARISEVSPDVVLFHHPFGFVDKNFRSLAEAAWDEGALVVEDCVRGLFSRDTSGQLLGSTGDIAMFSPRKVLPVPHGGLVVADGVEFPEPSSTLRERTDLLKGALTAIRRRYNPPPSVRAFLTNQVFDSQGSSTDTRVDHDWSGKGIGHISRLGLTWCVPEDIVSKRQEHYHRLRNGVLDIEGVEVLTPPAHEGSSPYGVVIQFPGNSRVRDRVHLALQRGNLPSERLDWPFLPGDAMDAERFPGAAVLRGETLVLPAHQQIPPGGMSAMLACIEGELRRSSSRPIRALHL